MSFFSKIIPKEIRNILPSVSALAQNIPAIGPALSGGLNLASGLIAATNRAQAMPTMMAGFPSLPSLAIGAGRVVGMGMAGFRTVARSANVYCRRHPAWCASIGGLPGVVGLLESGQLPTIRRRRGRGLTPRDLRSFRRVATLIKGFCPTVRRVPARALRGRKHLAVDV